MIRGSLSPRRNLCQKERGGLGVRGSPLHPATPPPYMGELPFLMMTTDVLTTVLYVLRCRVVFYDSAVSVGRFHGNTINDEK